MIEDHTDNPTRWPFDLDNSDELHDAERDRREERFAILHPAPAPRADGPLARAMKRHAERQAQMHAEQEACVSDTQVQGADSEWMALS